MDKEWGLTKNGFHRPSYVDLLNNLEYKARELFGDGINLTVRSPLGLFLRILAWMWNILFSCLEDVYNSRFVDTATGNSLYNLGKNIGMQVLPEGKATGYLTVSGEPGTQIPAGFLVGTYGGLQYTVVNPAVISEDGTATGIIQAVRTGPEYNTPADTIKNIVNPFAVPGITAVTNQSAVIGGREKETDAQFRQRYYDSIDYSGGVNADAIRAALLNDADGVTNVYVYENDSDETDSVYGLSPHSIEAVVCGGLDEEIAEVIYSKRPAGIRTEGNKAVSVMTASGQEMKIRFSRPDLKRVWVRIKNLTTEYGYPGDDAVKKALTAFIGDSSLNGLSIGADVIYIMLPGAVTASVPGIRDFDLTISQDGITYGNENISVGYREKAMTEESAVTIE